MELIHFVCSIHSLGTASSPSSRQRTRYSERGSQQLPSSIADLSAREPGGPEAKPEDEEEVPSEDRPWCFIPTKKSVEARYAFLKKMGHPFRADDEAKRTVPEVPG